MDREGQLAKIAVVVGSTREGSFNRMLGKLAIRALQAQGAAVTDVDLADFDLPLYSAAIEAGAFPADAQRLKEIFAAQDGLLFVSPEYNGSRSEEHTSELQSLMRISYAVFCLKKKKTKQTQYIIQTTQ